MSVHYILLLNDLMVQGWRRSVTVPLQQGFQLPKFTVSASLASQPGGRLQVLSSSEAVDPSPLWRRVAQLPLGRDMSDGGQHDCQEMLRLLMDSLHDDLVGDPDPARTVAGAERLLHPPCCTYP